MSGPGSPAPGAAGACRPARDEGPGSGPATRTGSAPAAPTSGPERPPRAECLSVDGFGIMGNARATSITRRQRSRLLRKPSAAKLFTTYRASPDRRPRVAPRFGRGRVPQRADRFRLARGIDRSPLRGLRPVLAARATSCGSSGSRRVPSVPRTRWTSGSTGAATVSGSCLSD